MKQTIIQLLNNTILFIENLSTLESSLIIVVIFLVVGLVLTYLKVRSIGFNFYSKSVSKTVESQIQQINTLEQQVKLFKRKPEGVIAKWAPPREDKAAYLLTIYNDTPEKIYNISLTVESKYKDCSQVLFENSTCESQKQVLGFFVPGGWSRQADLMTSRDHFVALWIQNKLNPIKFTISYTKTPISSDQKQKIEIIFDRTCLTQHLTNKIRNYHRKTTLKSVDD